MSLFASRMMTDEPSTNVQDANACLELLSVCSAPLETHIYIPLLHAYGLPPQTSTVTFIKCVKIIELISPVFYTFFLVYFFLADTKSSVSCAFCPCIAHSPSILRFSTLNITFKYEPLKSKPKPKTIA